jgi:hypothetical protein
VLARGAEGKIVARRDAAVFDPYELLGVLQSCNVGFVVVGAFARVVRGTREVTKGLDITPAMCEENLVRLDAALDDLGARRADGKPLELRKLAEPLIDLETSAGGIKLVPEPAGTGGYDDLRRRAHREPLGRGLRPRIASTDDLARMLSALHPDKDEERLLRLRRLMNLERKLARELDRDRGIER